MVDVNMIIIRSEHKTSKYKVRYKVGDRNG